MRTIKINRGFHEHLWAVSNDTGHTVHCTSALLSDTVMDFLLLATMGGMPVTVAFHDGNSLSERVRRSRDG